MKKLSLLFVIIFTLSSCAQEAIGTEDQEFNIDQTSFEKKGDKGAKIDVCHKGKIINVSANSLSGHLGHGDAVDMDGDGYFNRKNGCSEIDDNDDDDYYDGDNDDNDGDGETENEGDCDDNNAAVNSSAREICNGIDDNCDGNVDEDCPTIITCDVCQDVSFDEFCETLIPINISCYSYPVENTISILYSEGFKLEISNSENTDCFKFVEEFMKDNRIRNCNDPQ